VFANAAAAVEASVAGVCFSFL